MIANISVSLIACAFGGLRPKGALCFALAHAEIATKDRAFGTARFTKTEDEAKQFSQAPDVGFQCTSDRIDIRSYAAQISDPNRAEIPAYR